MKININDITLLDYVWYNSRTYVGIVICRDEITQELKSYIGAGTGESEVTDLTNIMMWGSRFPIEEAKKLCYFTE